MGCAGSSNKDPDDLRGGGGGGSGSGDYGGEEDDYQPLTTEEVNARIQCCDKPLLHTLGKSGITLRYAYLSQRGYYPEDLYKANQDAFKVIPSFNGDSNNMFLGVFDGHGSDGDACSYFVRDNIEANLKRAMEKHSDDFEMAFRTSFIETNTTMHDAVCLRTPGARRAPALRTASPDGGWGRERGTVAVAAVAGGRGGAGARARARAREAEERHGGRLGRALLQGRTSPLAPRPWPHHARARGMVCAEVRRQHERHHGDRGLLQG